MKAAYDRQYLLKGTCRWSHAVKIPLLFFLTLAVTFPSLYVFNAIITSVMPTEQGR